MQYRETVDPKSPAIILLSPSGAPHPFYAEFGWVGAAGTNVKLPTADTDWRQAGCRRARRRQAGDADLGQRRGPHVPPRASRSTTSICSRSRTASPTTARAPVTLYPYGLISRHGTPPTLGYYILHEGLIGVLGDKGLQEDHLLHDRREEGDQLQRHQCLVRHHRQVLGGDAAAGSQRAKVAGALLVGRDRQR